MFLLEVLQGRDSLKAVQGGRRPQPCGATYRLAGLLANRDSLRTVRQISLRKFRFRQRRSDHDHAPTHISAVGVEPYHWDTGLCRPCTQHLIARSEVGLAKYYEQQAQELRQLAKDWDFMAEFYAKHPELAPKGEAARHVAHCRAIADSYRKAGDEAEALGIAHREASAQRLLDRQDHAGLANYYAQQAQEFKQKARDWESLAEFYEIHPKKYDAVQAAEHAARCRAIAESYRKAAMEAEAMGAEHQPKP